MSAFGPTSPLAETRHKLQTAVRSYQDFLIVLNLAESTRIERSVKALEAQIKIDLPRIEAAAYDSHADEHDGHAAMCHSDTRQDLLRQITEWAQDPSGKCIFWLNGMAGTGKSTIARTVAQAFDEKGQLGGSFFFRRGEGGRGNPSRFFTTIAVQLVRRVPTLAPYVRGAIESETGISEKSLNKQFEKLIFVPLSQAINASIPIPMLVIVVDALDECERGETILSVLSETGRLQSIHVRIFLTSRPEFSIRRKFKNVPVDAHQDVILQDIDQDTINRDISVYLKDELARIRKDYNAECPDPELPSDWPGNEKIQALAKMAVPLFIFAATLCRFVGDATWGWNPDVQLARVLNQTSSEGSNLDRTYLPVLQQLVVGLTDSKKEKLALEFRKIIGTIVILEDHLPVSSLASLLDISKTDIDSRLRFLHSVLNIPSDQELPVRLLHLSFRDFLVDPEKRGKSWFWVDEPKTHEMIGTRCLEVMSCYLRKNLCDLKTPGALRNEVDKETLHDCLPPYIRYTCRYWVHHLEHSKRRICDQDAVHVFLHRHFLHWLEALSLMGKISESIALIDTLQLLTKVSTCAPNIMC